MKNQYGTSTKNLKSTDFCLADLFLEWGVEGGAAATTSDVVAIASPAIPVINNRE
jgi:hypothetical protein